MKIYRTELISDIQEKLFDISVNEISIDEIEFYSDKIEGVMSIDCMSNGYHVKGNLKAPYRLTCDRCLTIFKDLKSVEFDFILTDDAQLKYDKSDDLIYFPISENEFDLNPLFQELIQLELQMKILCKSDCKGLCSTCGINLNEKHCECNTRTNSGVWDKLKNLQGN